MDGAEQRGAASSSRRRGERDTDLTVTLAGLNLAASSRAGSAEGIDLAGDPSVLSRLMAVTDEANPDFAIVTP